MAQISLPAAERRLETYTPAGEPLPNPSKPRAVNRVAFSAAHVAADQARLPSGPALAVLRTRACLALYGVAG